MHALSTAGAGRAIAVQGLHSSLALTCSGLLVYATRPAARNTAPTAGSAGSYIAQSQTAECPGYRLARMPRIRCIAHGSSLTNTCCIMCTGPLTVRGAAGAASATGERPARDPRCTCRLINRLSRSNAAMLKMPIATQCDARRAPQRLHLMSDRFCSGVAAALQVHGRWPAVTAIWPRRARIRHSVSLQSSIDARGIACSPLCIGAAAGKSWLEN